jgi:hypothetical protein
MDIKESLEFMVREIIKTMQAEKEEPPKILFIFCDSRAHEPFEDQLIKLRNHGICYDMLFLDGETSSWLGLQRIECGGAGKVIAVDEWAPAPIELPLSYDAVVIPEIDLDNASRIVTGLKGTIKSEIVFAALVLKKLVVVGEDVPGIKRADRRTLKTLTMPKAYQKLFQKRIQEMKELGIVFRPQRELADTVIQTFWGKRPGRSEEVDTLHSATDDRLEFSGKLLSADWVKSVASFPQNRLAISRNTVVSPLALDLLKEKGIVVEYAGKG